MFMLASTQKSSLEKNQIIRRIDIYVKKNESDRFNFKDVLISLQMRNLILKMKLDVQPRHST